MKKNNKKTYKIRKNSPLYWGIRVVALLLGALMFCVFLQETARAIRIEEEYNQKRLEDYMNKETLDKYKVD